MESLETIMTRYRLLRSRTPCPNARHSPTYPNLPLVEQKATQSPTIFDSRLSSKTHYWEQKSMGSIERRKLQKESNEECQSTKSLLRKRQKTKRRDEVSPKEKPEFSITRTVLILLCSDCRRLFRFNIGLISHRRKYR